MTPELRTAEDLHRAAWTSGYEQGSKDAEARASQPLTLDVEAAKSKVMGWMTTTRGKQPDLWVPRSWVLDLLDELGREP